MTTKQQLMEYMWARACDHSHVNIYANRLGVTDIPNEKEYMEYSKAEYEKMYVSIAADEAKSVSVQEFEYVDAIQLSKETGLDFNQYGMGDFNER